jgi:hypothetical protein
MYHSLLLIKPRSRDARPVVRPLAGVERSRGAFCARGMPLIVAVPQREPSAERIGVVAGAATGRELFQFPHVASSENDVVGFEGGDEAGHHVSDALAPFLLAQPLQSLDPDMILVGGPLVRKVAELHGLDDAIHNHAGTEAGSEAQEEHLPAFVASEGLHGRIVDDLHGTPECDFEIKAARACRTTVVKGAHVTAA